MLNLSLKLCLLCLTPGGGIGLRRAFRFTKQAARPPDSEHSRRNKISVVLAGVPEDSAEVTSGSRSHKQVPDEVAVSDPLGEVEHDSRAIGKPSG